MSDKDFINKYPNTTTAKNLMANMVNDLSVKRKEALNKPKPPTVNNLYSKPVEGSIQTVMKKMGLSREEVVKRLKKSGDL